jgi:hypothetical protein
MNKKSNSRRLFLKTGLAAAGVLGLSNLIIAKEKICLFTMFISGLKILATKKI